MSRVTDLADVEAIEAQGLPDDLPVSTYEMIRRGAAIDPDGPALTFFADAARFQQARTWRYAELLADITRTANFFNRLGLTKDAVIAYVLPNLPETHLVIWGGQATGIVCAINPLLEGKAIALLLEAARADVLVTLAPFPGNELWPKIAAQLDTIGCLRHLVLVGADGRAAQIAEALPETLQVHAFGESIAAESPDALDSGRVFSPEDLSSYFCTGGTTGLPKLAKRMHRNEVVNAWCVSRFNDRSMGPGKTIFCGLPLFHVNAVLGSGLVPFSQGAHVLLGTPQGYRAPGLVARFWAIVEHYRINFFSGVPTLFASLLSVPAQDHDIGSLELAFCGAAPMPVEVFRAFEARTGVRILEGYGLTEGTCVSSLNPSEGERRIGSIGLRLPLQDMKTVIVDESGHYVRDSRDDEPGLLLVAGPNVFAGYVQAEHNEGLWLDAGDGKRWLNTGDLARRDAQGYFWLTGRKKELIIRGGHNIDPAAIEDPLHRHPAVQIAAAVGRPDSHAGEVPVAYVQLKPGATVTEDELLAFAAEAVGERAAIPKGIRIVEAMPLTGVGKIFKPELKRREAVDAVSFALREAGIEVAALDVITRARGASVLRVSLGDTAAYRNAAETVLGRFTFAYEFYEGV